MQSLRTECNWSLSRPGLNVLVAMGLMWFACVADAQQPLPPVLYMGDQAYASFRPTTADFPNPERGFYVAAGGSKGLLDTPTFDSHLDTIANVRNLRLAFARTVLPQTNLTTTQISAITSSFAAARTRGVKLILKFDYGDQGYEPGLSQILAHMDQLKPLLEGNKDVIAFVQAGFIGRWGEWNISQSGLLSRANMTTIRDGVLAMVPRELYVQFRYPYISQEMWWQEPLASSEAFSGSQKARSGFHNDCFMTANGDSSGFVPPGYTKPGSDLVITKTQLEQRRYAASVTQYAPSGGETCANASATPWRASCSLSAHKDESGQPGGILNEGARYHLTYLNHNYAKEFVDQWTAEGCYLEVRKSLGYRFELGSVFHQPSVQRGETVLFNVLLRNIGWSRIFSARPLVVTIVNGSTSYSANSKVDLRQLPPQADALTDIPVSLTIPFDAPTGSYSVYVSAPDIWPRTAGSSLFAIRFANAETATQMWDAVKARFGTGTKLDVR